MLLYGAASWQTTKLIVSRLRGFEGRCLRRILRKHWSDKISNQEVWKRTGIGDIILEVKQRRWLWLGHILRMGDSHHPRHAHQWTPMGKRAKWRPRGTWRRTMEAEKRKSGSTWRDIEHLAQDRPALRTFVDALCATNPYEEVSHIK